MQNIAEFRIIGRIGKIEVKENVTYLSVASNYNRKDGDNWKSPSHRRAKRRATQLRTRRGHKSGKTRALRRKIAPTRAHRSSRIAAPFL